jgi:AraC-like DNA-binding protein
MKFSLNSFSEVESYFYGFKKHFENINTSTFSLTEWILITEQYLLNKINLDRQNYNILNALHKILDSKGNTNISELCSYTNVSQRQLERLFSDYIGVSPKKLSSLIRYQYLWQNILFDKNYNIQDCVSKYGYTDQSHLLNDFKKYHSLSPMDAKMLANETK